MSKVVKMTNGKTHKPDKTDEEFYDNHVVHTDNNK